MKFLGIVIILFCGFLTTFTMLARGEFTATEMLWTMINVCGLISCPEFVKANAWKGLLWVRLRRVIINSVANGEAV